MYFTPPIKSAEISDRWCVSCVRSFCHSVSERVAKAVAFSGAMVRPSPLWSDHEFLENFCTVSVSFVSRLNREVTVTPKAFVCSCFLLVKNCVKMHTQTHHFWTKKDFFLVRGLAPSTTLHPVDAYGAAPSLLIQNTTLCKS